MIKIHCWNYCWRTDASQHDVRADKQEEAERCGHGPSREAINAKGLADRSIHDCKRSLKGVRHKGRLTADLHIE